MRRRYLTEAEFEKVMKAFRVKFNVGKPKYFREYNKRNLTMTNVESGILLRIAFFDLLARKAPGKFVELNRLKRNREVRLLQEFRRYIK